MRIVADDDLEDNDFVFIDNVNIAYSTVAPVAYTENAAAVNIMPAATVADPDAPANFNTGSLRVQLTAGTVAGDQLLFAGGATQSGGIVSVGGFAIGTVTGYGTSEGAGLGLARDLGIATGPGALHQPGGDQLTAAAWTRRGGRHIADAPPGRLRRPRG